MGVHHLTVELTHQQFEALRRLYAEVNGAVLNASNVSSDEVREALFAFLDLFSALDDL
jgi:hypothetical protein